MFTINDFRKVIKELDEMTGMNGADLPIKRTKSQRTLASFVSSVTRNTLTNQVVRVEPVRFEVSGLILSLNDEKTFREIIKHEYCHYLANIINQDNCNHDKRFKEQCRRIGAEASEPTFTNNAIQEASEKLAKHRLICNECGHVHTFSRMCSTIKAAVQGNATCSCGSRSFTYKSREDK